MCGVNSVSQSVIILCRCRRFNYFFFLLFCRGISFRLQFLVVVRLSPFRTWNLSPKWADFLWVAIRRNIYLFLFFRLKRNDFVAFAESFCVFNVELADWRIDEINDTSIENKINDDVKWYNSLKKKKTKIERKILVGRKEISVSIAHRSLRGRECVVVCANWIEFRSKVGAALTLDVNVFTRETKTPNSGFPRRNSICFQDEFEQNKIFRRQDDKRTKQCWNIVSAFAVLLLHFLLSAEFPLPDSIEIVRLFGPHLRRTEDKRFRISCFKCTISDTHSLSVYCTVYTCVYRPLRSYRRSLWNTIGIISF